MLILLSGWPGGFLRLPVYCDGCFRADQRTHRASGAAVADQMSRMVTLGCEMFHIQRQHMLWALIHTQLAALTVNLTYNDSAFEGHLYLLYNDFHIKKYKNRQQSDKRYNPLSLCQ
jgi:hypothetical protein